MKKFKPNCECFNQDKDFRLINKMIEGTIENLQCKQFNNLIYGLWDYKFRFPFCYIITKRYMKALLTTGALLGGYYLTQKKKIQCCGIIGILSDKRDNIAPSLSLGVELLKNRGYDSAGIVTFSTQ